MSIRQIRHADVDLIDPDETVFDAARRMRSRRVGSLVVVNDAYEPVGIVTDRDIVVRVLALGLSPRDTTVDRIMTKPPETVSEHATAVEALRVMSRGGFRRVPVVDRLGKLAGIVTLDDVLRRTSDELQLLGGVLRKESPRPRLSAGASAAPRRMASSRPARKLVVARPSTR